MTPEEVSQFVNNMRTAREALLGEAITRHVRVKMDRREGDDLVYLKGHADLVAELLIACDSVQQEDGICEDQDLYDEIDDLVYSCQQRIDIVFGLFGRLREL